MTELTEIQLVFLEKFLGCRPAGPGDFASRWNMARSNWESAVRTVDGQISKLQSVLKTSEDPELVEIAEFGLNAITGNHKVRVMSSVFEISSAGAAPESKIVGQALKRISAFENHIANDERIKATDLNPFGVSVSISATMGAALGELSRALKSAA